MLVLQSDVDAVLNAVVLAIERVSRARQRGSSGERAVAHSKSVDGAEY